MHVQSLITRLAKPHLLMMFAMSRWQGELPLSLSLQKRLVLSQNPSDLVFNLVLIYQAPPQLWKVETVRDRDNNCLTSRLTLKHTFVLKVHVDFAGPCYFGGRDDQFVWCAGKGLFVSRRQKYCDELPQLETYTSGTEILRRFFTVYVHQRNTR